MKTVGPTRNKNCVALLTAMALVFVLGVMFSAAACGQGRSSSGSAIDAAQKQRLEQLYAEDADAWSRHDIAKILSFFDPTLVIVAPDGKRTSYAEWRQNLPASLTHERHSQVRTTVKHVQGVETGFVASIEWQDSSEVYDTNRWIPRISTSSQEDTWRSDGRGNFKIVLVKFLFEDTSPVSPILARSGNYQLTEEMIQRALLLAQLEAGADFAPSDAASLRADLIAYFQKEPAKQVEAHESIAKILQQGGVLQRGGIRPRKPSWLDLAWLRAGVWQWLAENQQDLREWQRYPFGKMVLKYNPILVNSGGTIVTKADVDGLFYSNALVAQAAGVAPPTQAEKDQFTRTLPSRFASMPAEQKEQLRHAETRLFGVNIVYTRTIKTRAAMIADIKRNVHSSADVPNEARRVENDSELDGKYWQSYLSEAQAANWNAQRFLMGLSSLGEATQNVMRNGQVPQGTFPGGAPR